MSERPSPLLDVDGPLNPFGARVRLQAGHGARLSALPYQLTWATAWCRRANELVAPAIGLPGYLPVVEWPPTPCGRQPDGVHRKTRPLLEWAAGRPFARVDDEVTERDAEHVATHHPGTALLLRIDPRKRLRDRDFGQLERWANALAQA
jgi:hypothetical protein